MSTFHIRLLAIAAGLMALSHAEFAHADRIIRCESRNGQYASCSVDTYDGVELTRQLSREGCWEGDTWGYDRNRIWVTNGCRAEFRVGRDAPVDNTGAKVAGALVLGAVVGGVIADRRNDDDDRYDDHWGGGGGWGREFTCSSTNGRLRYCGSVAPRERVEIRRRLSDSPCVFGRTWGVSRRQVWVNNGCRAVFVVR